ncbi:winged helix-turn-helix domain-containing protein [Pantoea dispersa]|uniref:winged helix-turn-helix domain-containing protein n=1 Tax=Pantoea dispersa TaxID=59814 RepID=UPI002DB565E4|nr:winged helix-turn-helix domain-containing protein [Pantoea dispersa]MEB5973502.1 winged helix-turn-helix domain-containing protein [Pantoea dispersa]
MKKIIIGNGVVFYPGKREIKSHNTNLKLHSSASYCFELLIARQGEIVDHEAFYQYAWRRFGMEVSANALYQSISLIRKALLACDICQDVIRTIPRRGFMLSNAILIEESAITPEDLITDEERATGEGEQKNEKCSFAIDPANKNVLSKKNKDPETHNTDEITDTLISNKQHSEKESKITSGNLEPPVLTLKKGVKRHTISLRHFFNTGLAMMTVLVCGFSIMTFSLYRQKMDFVKRFDMNGCEIYGSKKADNSLIVRVAKGIHTECSERRNVFITAFTNGERISVLQCKTPLSLLGSPDCISYYYIRRKW